MGRDPRRSYRHCQHQSPPRSTPATCSFTTILPPISTLTHASISPSRSSFASSSASLSSPSPSHSTSSRASGPIEPQSPLDGQPLLNSTRNMNIASRSNAHRSGHSSMPHEHHSSNTDSYHHSHRHSAPLHHTRPAVEDGSHLWGDGMKGIWNSLTGAPHPKSRSPVAVAAAATNSKVEYLDPSRPSDVQAATSTWDVPRDTVAMTMGFQNSYEDRSIQSQQVWQPQQMSNYPADAHHHHQQQQAHLNHASAYSTMPAPSGLAAAPADPTRPRGASGGTDRHYSRRPNYPQHGHPAEACTDASSGGQWWGDADANPVAQDANHYGARRLQPPQLPETRSASRPTSSNNGGFEMSGYESPQSTLGKRQYDQEAIASSTSHGVAADNGDSAAVRRYSLNPNLSFSRPSAPISSMMNSYRPLHSDPNRPSLPSDPYGVQPPASTAQRTGYSNPSHYNPWDGATSHSGLPAMTNSDSSPSLSGWRDTNVMRYGIEATGYPSPSSIPGGPVDKRQQRDRSSSTASAVQQSNNLANNLTNTPFHITTDIVLRAPAGSKMEDVYYDQHCELRTGMADPPTSDFEVENEEDRPRLQTDKLRFPGDLYTPRWVRGSGNSREAWCDRCESGNWLQLKNSQYWYDQVHKHGISSVSGLRFTAPTHLKIYADAAGTVEGKCHQCKEWVLIYTAKRRRNFAAFFKHAHACHSYRKVSAVGNGPYVEHNPGGHRNKKGTSSPI